MRINNAKVFPKVLVVSNECFSKSSSNGRTLGNYFLGWPKDRLAQFYISGTPDFDYCEIYYRVTDKQALKSIIFRGNAGGRISKSNYTKLVNNPKSAKKSKRNAVTMLLRNFAWENGSWKNNQFDGWIKSFCPDIILLQAGDCPFMFKLANYLSNTYKTKLVIYNSEGYYFKNYDYFRANGLAHLIFPFFIQKLRKNLEEAYSKTDYVIYNCDKLRNDYAKIFSVKSTVIYTSANVDIDGKSLNRAEHHGFITSYCGNIGVGRHQSLIEVAKVLQTISDELFIDVYGKIPDEKILEEIKSCKGIHYHGIVPYETVNKVLRSSDLVLHVESFDNFYQEDIKYGFSTKIADLLSTGKCFLLYAPSSLACYSYLNKNDAAFTICEKNQLETVLREIIKNPKFRSKFINRAKEISHQNHDANTNKQIFRDVLLSVYSQE